MKLNVKIVILRLFFVICILFLVKRQFHLHNHSSLLLLMEEVPEPVNNYIKTQRLSNSRTKEEESSAIFVANLQKKQQYQYQANTHTNFNYTEFWNIALSKALINQQRLEQEEKVTSYSHETCPKVFLYNLTGDALRGIGVGVDQTVSSDYSTSHTTIDEVFGKSLGMDGFLRDTHMYSFATIAEHRLRSSKYCQTQDPEQADLFWIPLLTKRKLLWDDWRNKICPSSHQITSELLQQLHYLTPTTACRHVLVIGNCHHVPTPCVGWWSSPVVPQLQNTMRLALSHISYNEGAGNGDYMTSRNDTSIQFPNLHSVPFPSSYHWNSSTLSSTQQSYLKPPPWTQFTNRNILMSFIGTATHGDVKARKTIVKQCDSYQNTTICMKHNPWDKKVNWYEIKQHSIFCLEPIGDNPWRKSLSDSLVLGCIPVLFSNLTDNSAQFSWGSWQDQGRILVSRRALVRGELDLFALLVSIPSQLLKLIQTSLSEYSRRFQYSLNEDPNDALRMALNGLVGEAHRLESQGVCPPRG